MQQTRKRLIDTILFFVLIALEAVFIILFISVQHSDSPPLMADIYVAGIAICAILLVFLGLTRVGPALLQKRSELRLKTPATPSQDSLGFDPEGFRDRLVAALEKDGFSLTETEIAQNGGDPMKVTLASGKAFSLFFDRVYRYVIITEDFRKARDFDVLRLCSQKLIESEEMTDDTRSRSGFSTVVILLMAHVPEQVRAACREEAVVEGPAYVPVACDLSTGKAYCLTGKAFALMEFRTAQNMIRKYIGKQNPHMK